MIQKNSINCSKTLAILQGIFTEDKNWTITPLTGGLSGASIFLAEEGGHKYVVKHLDHLLCDESERLILAQQAAYLAGCGPKIHWYDLAQSVVVMDFLEAEPPVDILKNLALLMQKIHQTPKVGVNGRLWERIYEVIVDLKKVKQNFVDLDLVKSTLDQLVAEASKSLDSKTCHRDLNPANLIFQGGQFYAVDYDTVGVDDPYIDIAALVLFYCWENHTELELLSLYLGRTPTHQEISKLALFQKISCLFYGVEFLISTPPEYWAESPELIPYEAFMRSLRDGKISLDTPSERLKLGLILIQSGMG